MFVQVHTAALSGVDAFPVRVEVHLGAGLPAFTIVGLPQGSVREGRERVGAALRSSGYSLPSRRITVNLAPADVRKVGTAFDLPIAVAILAAAGEVPHAPLADVVFAGELGLDGAVRPVRGVLSVALRAAAEGYDAVVVPLGNRAEARLVEGIDVRCAPCLASVVTHLAGRERLPNARDAPGPPGPAREDSRPKAPDLADVRGQATAKRALEIAAAGDHNVLLVGPPGAGKTMLARRLPGLLPPLDVEEAIEVARLRSVAGLLLDGALPRARPFRAPHHSVSYAGLHGGGRPLRPGEVSLAHKGVLFLDELPEFRRDALEMLRQPLEEGFVALARAGSTVRFPSRFQLVAAMNPCPCGFHGDPDRCTCDPAAVRRYRGRVSGPLLDRIDLHVDVAPVPAESLLGSGRGEGSQTVAARVSNARARRRARALGPSFGTVDDRVRRDALTSDARALLAEAIGRLGLSARAHDRVVRVARTVADLEGADAVDALHLAEALHFRASGGCREVGAREGA